MLTLPRTIERVKGDHVACQDPRHFYWQFELTGTGAYEGHTALLYAKGPTGGPFAVEGFVFPGSLPDYPTELPAE